MRAKGFFNLLGERGLADSTESLREVIDSGAPVKCLPFLQTFPCNLVVSEVVPRSNRVDENDVPLPFVDVSRRVKGQVKIELPPLLSYSRGCLLTRLPQILAAVWRERYRERERERERVREKKERDREREKGESERERKERE